MPWPYRPHTNEELLALAGEMLRHDPRLLSILVQHVLSAWSTWNPLALRREMARMRWPQALLVVLGFARLASAEPELGYFAEYVAAGWPRIEPVERFFLDAERPGSRVAERRLGRNLVPYARWGFLGSERPTVDAATKRTVGRYDARTRRRLLEELIDQRGEVTLADVLVALDHAVSRQQARQDMRALPGVETIGHGRGARWRRARKARAKRPPAKEAQPRR